ncbi:MAG: ABC transporter substrate-binding protein [Actinomycetota bacterium]|nr:ABC transporter substrate-binding protein [Actinomycetota bacterium]
MVEGVASVFTGRGRARAPVGVVRVVDPSPLNWLHITYNTVEELVRVTTQGKIRPAAMRRYRWVDDRTLEVDVREGERFPDGEPLNALSVKRSFDEVARWTAPHPTGTHFNIDPRTSCEVIEERTVRFYLPEPDGLALGKLRAAHLMSTRFWEEIGFVYKRNGTGEGRGGVPGDLRGGARAASHRALRGDQPYLTANVA